MATIAYTYLSPSVSPPPTPSPPAPLPDIPPPAPPLPAVAPVGATAGPLSPPAESSPSPEPLSPDAIPPAPARFPCSGVMFAARAALLSRYSLVMPPADVVPPPPPEAVRRWLAFVPGYFIIDRGGGRWAQQLSTTHIEVMQVTRNFTSIQSSAKLYQPRVVVT